MAALVGWRLRFRLSEAGPRLAARHPRGTTDRPAAGPPRPRRLPGPARPGLARLPGQRRPSGHRPQRAVRDRLQAVDRTGPPGRRRAHLAHYYRLDRTLATVRWQAETLGRLLGIPVAPLICVHGATSRVAGCGPKAWPSSPPSCSAPGSTTTRSSPRSTWNGTRPPPGRGCGEQAEHADGVPRDGGGPAG
jgi:hypothetical protein